MHIYTNRTKSTGNTQLHVGSAVRIFEISNGIEQLRQYLIRCETNTIIPNFRILTVTDFLLI